jgi:adenosylhomocysteine nucleosidase
MNRSTPPGPAASVLIVSGLKREAAILAGPGRLAICGDASTLRAKLAELTCQPIILVISWGVCGGLDPRLRPGDLILGAEVVSAEGRINTDEAVTSSLAQRLIDAGARVAVERVAGASSPVSTARAKAELRLATGAAAVDMESLTAGRFALERRTPFAILRAVADPADRDLPPLVLSAVDSAARDGRAAFRALSRCRGLLPGLFLGLGPANL